MDGTAPASVCEPGVFVGREAALALLEHALARAASGTRQIVFVTGEPGIGKTTLLDEFLRRLGVTGLGVRRDNARSPITPSLLLAHGQCADGFGTSDAYMPLLEALERLCRQSASGDVVALLRRLAPTWLLQLPRLLEAGEQDELRRMLAGSSGERMVRELLSFVEELTADRVVVLILEDLHWSDRATVGALAALAARREAARLLVVASYRPADAIAQLHPVSRLKHELTAKGQCVEVTLQGLEADAVDAYLAGRFPQHRLPLELAARLQAQTSGNPLFMLNALADFMQRGWLDDREGAWECTVDLGTLAAAVPEGTREMIGFRLQQLSTSDIDLLEGASVIGVSFASQALAAVLERAPAEVEVDCSRLARAAQFLGDAQMTTWPGGSVGVQHTFRHALYQQVLLERVTPARRRLLHLRVADCLETGFADQAKTIAPQLALHFERGGDLQRAVHYRHQAGSQAVDRFAYDQAIEHLRAALELLRDVPASAERDAQELSLQTGLLPLLYVLAGSQSRELAEAIDRVHQLSDHGPAALDLFRALASMVNTHCTGGNMPAARRVSEQMVERAADPLTTEIAVGILGFCQLMLGEIVVATEKLQRAGRLPEIPGANLLDPGIVAASAASLGHCLLGHPVTGRELEHAALARAETLNHPATILNVIVGGIRTGVILLDDQLVANSTATLAALPEQIRGRMMITWQEIGAGWLDIRRGQDGGADRIQRARQTLFRDGLRNYQPLFAGTAATGFLRDGDHEQADAVLDEGLTLTGETGECWYEAELHRLRGEVRLARAAQQRRATKKWQQLAGDAEACFRQALEVARGQGAKWWELRTAVSLAHLLADGDRAAEARHLLRSVYDAFTTASSFPICARRGRYCSHRSRPEVDDTILRRACRCRSRTSARPPSFAKTRQCDRCRCNAAPEMTRLTSGPPLRREAIHVAVIGAGMAGILAAIKLREAGYDRVVVYEKADRLGGTWRENTYPGLSCDVPSHFYSYSFALNPEWSHRFAPGPEIRAYFEDVARRGQVDTLVRYNCEVTGCSFESGRWRLDLSDGTSDETDFVIAATGVLHHPAYPDIPGLESFAGPCFHSARWDHGIGIDGKRVGVVGTGSSAIQIVGAIVDQVAALRLFQRTPQWIAPMDNPAYSDDEKAAFRSTPAAMEEVRETVSRMLSDGFANVLSDAESPMLWGIHQMCVAHLESSVRDPVLRERLRPSYRAGCKRLVMSDRFYEAIQRPNATLVTEGIERVEPGGMRTRDGVLHPLDVLVLATGFPIIVGSWNPLDACYEPNQQRDDPSWPSPPSALGCWQTDNEMGASYSLAFMAHLAENGVAGYQAMYQLDDADWGGSEEFPHDWGLRTNKNKHGLRKAIYHAQTIVGRMPRSLVSVSATHANPADEYFPHVYALAGAEGDRLGVLLWSYVTSPGRQVVEVLRDMGYDSADFVRWGGQTQIAAFLANAVPVSALTSVAAEQADLERMKDVFYRQRALVTETNQVSLAIDGFASTGGYRVNRWLIDATHNNTYRTYVTSGLNAAIATEQLQQLDTQLLAQLSQIPDINLAPYAVMLLEIERVAGTNGCANPSVVGDARLTLRTLQAPPGDDQLKVRGTVTVPTSPPINLAAHGLRLVLNTNTGGGLADLTAPAGSNWSVNGSGTAWKYRNPSASSGTITATVRAIGSTGTLRVRLKARGLALGAAPAGTPPVATIAFGVPTAAPGQCGVTAFAACRTSASGATMRCP